MEKLLLVLVLVLAVIGIAQITKVYRLSNELSKSREEDISQTSNKWNGNLLFLFMLAMFAFFIWHLVEFGDVLLPVAASAHGAEVDALLNFNWGILFFVFFVVNFLLFYFARKYSYNPNRKALFLAHNNKLELVWTVVPTIVLAIIIIYGLRTWNQIMDDPSEDALVVELYSKQFDWTARYPGEDGKLGEANFTMITAQNPLGLITPEGIEARLAELDEEIEKAENKIANEILPDSQVEELEERIGMRSRQRAKVSNFKESERDFSTAYDDKVVKLEFHLPIRKEVTFEIRSRDVIHSAYMPHFRAQMNAVPGMTTKFTFTPTITTDSMRTILGDEEFNYVLLCNKVCGSAHYNMQMNIIVESEEKYNEWLSQQKAFVTPEPLDGQADDAARENEEERIIAVNQKEQ
jgi:cytochrome c oxidase subunit 2